MAFDPENPTFYGACLQVDFARDVTGNSVAVKYTNVARDGHDGGALRYLYNDTDHQWFDPGDSAMVGFFPERGMLTLEDDVTFALVVELRDDSTGSLRISAGVDPDFALTDPTLASEPLGTFSADGAGAGGTSQIVVPVSSWTGAMIYAGQVEPIVLFEALDGRPRIAQARVRMWPTGGVAGSWESDPDYVIEDVRPRFMVSDGAADMSGAGKEDQSLGSQGPRNHSPGPGIWGGFDDYGDTEGTFFAMRDWLNGHDIPPYQSFKWTNFSDGYIRGGYSFTWTLRQLADPGHDWTGGFFSAMVLIAADPVVQSGRQGAAVYPDPDRVPGEKAAAVRNGRTGGTLKSIFVAWTSQPQISPAGSVNDEMVGVRTFSLGAEPWSETDSGGAGTGASFDYYFATSGIDAASGGPPDPPDATQVPLPGIPLVGVEVNGSHTSTPGDERGLSSYEFSSSVAGGSRTVTFEDVRATHRYEDVQWYNPGGVVKPIRKPRFYVTYTEVDEHPVDVSHVVGIGKPATDLSIFRVPTPLGTLRELRHGEKVSDVSVAYPLKVKLEDGSWTVVAGMTPDE